MSNHQLKFIGSGADKRKKTKKQRLILNVNSFRAKQLVAEDSSCHVAVGWFIIIISVAFVSINGLQTAMKKPRVRQNYSFELKRRKKKKKRSSVFLLSRFFFSFNILAPRCSSHQLSVCAALFGVRRNIRQCTSDAYICTLSRQLAIAVHDVCLLYGSVCVCVALFVLVFAIIRRQRQRQPKQQQQQHNFFNFVLFPFRI